VQKGGANYIEKGTPGVEGAANLLNVLDEFLQYIYQTG